MTALLEIALVLCGFVSVVTFVCALLASWVLPFCTDEEKLKWDVTGARRWAINPFQKMPDIFTPTGVQLWRIRDISLKGFAMNCGVAVVIAIVAAVADIKLEP